MEPTPTKSDLERLSRLASIGEIAAEVAHELRNSLQIIAANVYLAKQDVSKSEAHLAKIERSTRIAQGIVDDLMALARGEPAHAERVSLGEIVEASREDLVVGACVTFVDQLGPAGHLAPDLEVRAHPGLLARCLHVLYENAISASASRAVTITTSAHHDDAGRCTVIHVADDGPGVPPEIVSTVFEPLVTVREGGTGLGLALARRVVAAHGGTIALVDSEAGATFRIQLPI